MVSEKNCAPGWQAKGAAVSGSDDSVGTVELHEQSHLQPRVALSAVIAEAVAAGALQIGGRFELRDGWLRREVGR